MTWYGDIYHNGDWFNRAGVKQASPEQNFTETAIRRALAKIYGGGSGALLGTVQPTLADLLPYQSVTAVGGYTKYANIPWGPCFGVEAWAEPTLAGSPTLQPVVTIYIPPGPVPEGGFPILFRTHANGNTHEIPEGSGSLWTELVVRAMEGKRAVASLEFRHPVPNVALGAPHLDVGYGVQFVRALSSALQLNPNIVDCYATSRGNLALWQTLSPELADAGNSNFAKRQSSKIRAIYGVNTQDSYSTTEFITQKVVAGDQAACLADPTYADDPRWGSAQQLILNGTEPLPYLSAVYDMSFVTPLPSTSIGRYTKAALDADSNLRVHCPEFGKALAAAYAARGASKKMVLCDEVNGGVNTTADCVAWLQILDEHPGISAKAARAQAQQRRIGGTLHYFEGASPSGAYSTVASPTPVTADGTAFGVLVDGAWGTANRLNTVAPLGAPMGQSTNSLRPKLATIPASGNRAMVFDADDTFKVGLTNTSVDVMTYPVGAASIQGASTRGSGNFTVGSDKVAGKTVSLIAAVPNTTFAPQELKFLGQLALELEGVL